MSEETNPYRAPLEAGRPIEQDGLQLNLHRQDRLELSPLKLVATNLATVIGVPAGAVCGWVLMALLDENLLKLDSRDPDGGLWMLSLLGSGIVGAIAGALILRNFVASRFDDS